jgi:hypothetical protein
VPKTRPLTKKNLAKMESPKKTMKKDYIRNNVMGVTQQFRACPDKPVENLDPNFGKTPTYLKTRATTLAKEAEAKRMIKVAKTYPPGTRMLSEKERLTTLANLKNTVKEMEGTLNSLPISMDTF